MCWSSTGTTANAILICHDQRGRSAKKWVGSTYFRGGIARTRTERLGLSKRGERRGKFPTFWFENVVEHVYFRSANVPLSYFYWTVTVFVAIKKLHFSTLPIEHRTEGRRFSSLSLAPTLRNSCRRPSANQNNQIKAKRMLQLIFTCKHYVLQHLTAKW